MLSEIINPQSNTSSPSNVFFIHSTKQISTGYSPFFYYRGSFNRSMSQSCSTSADSLLLCSIDYEPASPRPLHRLHSQNPPMAPYRLSFREYATESLILTHRGLHQNAIVDSQRLTVYWGADLILVFPSKHDMLSLITNLKGVNIVELAESSTEIATAGDVSSLIAPDTATLPWCDHKRAITPPSLKCGRFDDGENDDDCCAEDSMCTPKASIKVTPVFSTDSKYAGSVPSTPHYRHFSLSS